MSHLIDVIIPTYNNREYLIPCIRSIFDISAAVSLRRVIVVNNGDPHLYDDIAQDENLVILNPGKNLGWEGGLAEGLKISTSPYVMFLNDDTFIPVSNGYWLNKLMRHFVDPKVAAVGPSSNVVMGLQSIFAGGRTEVSRVRFLIGFCVLVRREALDKIGGLDLEHPNHGDDLDWSIRLRDLGYDLVCDKTVFVYHHGFKTGSRVTGSYWNSAEMQEKTNHHLIRKHGLRKWYETVAQQEVTRYSFPDMQADSEGDLVRKYVIGNDVLELGCGAKKTVPHAVGVDIIAKDDNIPTLGEKCVADVQGDVTSELPFEKETFDTVIARHILEHTPDTLKTLEHWKTVLKHGGRLIVAVPDESKAPTIPMNIEHKVAFTQDSLRRLMGAAGFNEVVTEDSNNYISFVGVYSKNGLH